MNSETGNPKYVYHYCAEWREENEKLYCMDGIARMVNKVEDIDDYNDLKALISPEVKHKITITNLSLIGEL